MHVPPSFTDLLSALSPEELAALIIRRPRTISRFSAQNIPQLAELFANPWSMVESLNAVPLPSLEVLETTLAIGSAVTVDLLTEVLAPVGDGSAVWGGLTTLAEQGLVWLDTAGRIYWPATLTMMFPNPLELGPAPDEMVERLSVADLKRILGAVNHPAIGKRQELQRALLEFYLDFDRIREIVYAAPTFTRDAIELWASRGSPFEFEYNSSRYAQTEATFRWARDRGLLYGYNSYEAQMPAVVALALRTRSFRPPFHPTQPPIPAAEVSPTQVQADAAAAAGDFSGIAVDVLDLVDRTGIQMLKTGGVGSRELSKLATTVKTDEGTVRLILELADRANLLDAGGPRLTTTAGYELWRSADPAIRYTELIGAWWNLEFCPTDYRGPDGKANAALRGAWGGFDDIEVRRQLFATVAEQPIEIGVFDVESFIAAVAWRFPRLVGSRPSAPRAIWDEAVLLGIIALGACTQVGRALDRGDAAGVLEAARAILPSASSGGIFGSDLTVMVSGSPSAQVSRTLDACADRESRGAAVVWRFSPASIRRALDAGLNATSITGSLELIAGGILPQPLNYLIGDVQRRHGTVLASSASCVLTSEDTALLTEISLDRALKKLDLRLVAPTVVVSAQDVLTTLASLRGAGYLPMPASGEASIVKVERETVSTDAAAKLGAIQLARPDRLSATSLESRVRKIMETLIEGESLF